MFWGFVEINFSFGDNFVFEIYFELASVFVRFGWFCESKLHTLRSVGFNFGKFLTEIDWNSMLWSSFQFLNFNFILLGEWSLSRWKIRTSCTFWSLRAWFGNNRVKWRHVHFIITFKLCHTKIFWHIISCLPSFFWLWKMVIKSCENLKNDIFNTLVWVICEVLKYWIPNRSYFASFSWGNNWTKSKFWVTCVNEVFIAEAKLNKKICIFLDLIIKIFWKRIHFSQISWKSMWVEICFLLNRVIGEKNTSTEQKLIKHERSWNW